MGGKTYIKTARWKIRIKTLKKTSLGVHQRHHAIAGHFVISTSYGTDNYIVGITFVSVWLL